MPHIVIVRHRMLAMSSWVADLFLKNHTVLLPRQFWYMWVDDGRSD